MRPGHAYQCLPGRRIGDYLLPRLHRHAGATSCGQLRVIWVDRGQGLGHCQPLRQPLRDVAGVVAPIEVNARGLDGRCIRRRPTSVATAHRGTSVMGQQRGRAGAGAAGTDYVNALACADWPRRSGGREATPDVGGAADGAHASPGWAETCSTSSSKAARAAASRTPTLSPLHRKRRTSAPAASATATYARPTGLAAPPPPGPAIPVTETAKSAPTRWRAPMAMDRATCALTAPWAASSSSRTPSSPILASFEYETIPPRK